MPKTAEKTAATVEDSPSLALATKPKKAKAKTEAKPKAAVDLIATTATELENLTKEQNKSEHGNPKDGPQEDLPSDIPVRHAH